MGLARLHYLHIEQIYGYNDLQISLPIVYFIITIYWFGTLSDAYLHGIQQIRLHLWAFLYSDTASSQQKSNNFFAYIATDQGR